MLVKNDVYNYNKFEPISDNKTNGVKRSFDELVDNNELGDPKDRIPDRIMASLFLSIEGIDNMVQQLEKENQQLKKLNKILIDQL